MSRDSRQLLWLFAAIVAIPVALAGFIVIRYSLEALIVLVFLMVIVLVIGVLAFFGLDL